MPTIADNYQSINQILNQLGNLLIEEINQFYVTKDKKVNITCNTSIIQQGNNTTLMSKVTDLNDNAIANVPVKFYIDEDYNSQHKNINISGDISTQVDDTIHLTSIITDDNNNPIKGQYVYFYINDYSIEQIVSDNIDALINAIESIDAVEVENNKNIKPVNIPQIDNTDLSTFNCTLYQRILYYMQLLGYYLVLKGVPLYKVNNATTLHELIELIPLIDYIKPSILNITPIDEIQYYGANIHIEYFLKDIDGFDIEEGDITIQDSNGITYDSITAGNQLRFTPMTVSPKINGEYQAETYTVIYHGSNKYQPSNVQTFSIKVVPTPIRLNVTMTNMANNSRYYKSMSMGYETDDWEIKIQALDHQNQPLVHMPFSLMLPGFIALEEELTDENGMYITNQVINQVGNHTLICETLYENTDFMSNVTKEVHVTIKYNILKQNNYEYEDYTGKNNYTYEIYLINEDTGLPDTQYNGQSVDVFLEQTVEEVINGETCYNVKETRQGTATIVNDKATYTFNHLSAGEKRIRWTFNTNNFTTHSITKLNILSNFILPDKQSYFLQDTPQIIYAPLGQRAANNTVTGTIEYDIVTYNEVITGYNQEQIIIGYETETIITYLYKTQYNENTGEFEYVLDENNQPIPIYEVDDNDNLILDENNQPIQAYESEEIQVLDEHGNPIPIYDTVNTDPIIEITPNYQHHEENITLTTNNNGVLNNISSYKDIGQYKLYLTSSNNLNETVIFEYELKEPFEIELIDYNKKEYVVYDIIVYDKEHYNNSCISIKNGRDTQNIVSQNLYNMSTTSTDEYNTVRVTVPLITQTLGYNTLFVNINGYQQSKSFQLFNYIFTLLTPSVPLGENTIQIQCNDESITSIDIDSEYIEVYDIEYNNGIFNVSANFIKGGAINFNVIGDDETTEVLSIQVTKKDLLPDISASVNVKNPIDPRSETNYITYIDLSNTYISFDIDTVIYSNLFISFSVDNTIINNLTYYSDSNNNTFTLSLPNNIRPGNHTINFIFNGDNNYYAFNKTVNFEILKATPTHTISEQYTAFKDTQFFIYQPEFTEENPETLIKESCSSATSSQSNGVWDFVGYYLSEGWANTGLWECDFDISGDIRYVGLDILCALSPSNQITILMTGWEGPVATNPPGTYTRDNDSTLSFLPKKLVWTVTNPDTQTYISRFTECHINMKKTSPTTLTITKTNGECNNGSVTYEWQNLSNYPKLTIGSHVNPAGCRREGSIQIKNFVVRGVY